MRNALKKMRRENKDRKKGNIRAWKESGNKKLMLQEKEIGLKEWR